MYNASNVLGCRLVWRVPRIVGKDLVAASATPLVLSILAEGDSYGYAILQRVSELSGGQLSWTDGMLYPVLHRLEQPGCVASRWESPLGGRCCKYYRITATGRRQLEGRRRQWTLVNTVLRGASPKAVSAESPA